MLFEHQSERPRIHETAYIAPTATLCGAVTIGAHSRVLHGAVLVAEGGPVDIGVHCIIMENAVVRGLARHPTRIGNHTLVGPHAHLTGCTVEDEVFIATGSSVFNGAVLGKGSTVRINGIVHVRTTLPAGTKMPIGWVAVGDPVALLPPEADEQIAERLREQGFSQTVFGLPPSWTMRQLTERYTRALDRHRTDRILDS